MIKEKQKLLVFASVHNRGLTLLVVGYLEHTFKCSVFRTFHCVWLAKCLGEFDYVRLPNPIERSEFDLVRLPRPEYKSNKEETREREAKSNVCNLKMPRLVKILGQLVKR